jgi:hypothetical protein
MTVLSLAPRLARLAAITIAGLLAAPHAAGAQSAARVAPDRPSTNAETRRQSDSLTVHFLRTPKAKPNVRSGAALGTAAAKAAGDTARATPATTPLPTRSRKPKQ